MWDVDDVWMVWGLRKRRRDDEGRGCEMGRVTGRGSEVIDDGSRDAVKGRPAKVHFVWTLAYALIGS